MCPIENIILVAGHMMTLQIQTVLYKECFAELPQNVHQINKSDTVIAKANETESSWLEIWKSVRRDGPGDNNAA
jgi:hypothetical protein